MKLYACSNCKNTLYFENSECLHCKHPVGFDAQQLKMATLDPASPVTPDIFLNATNRSQAYRFCHNAQYQVCNWLLPAGVEAGYCIACALNRTIPTLADPSNLYKWRHVEVAKHRLIYSLLRLQLPFATNVGSPPEAVAFDFKSDLPGEAKVFTGHSNGLITINIAEADEALRTRHKQDLGERYRTLLGHFRHEIGHFYWDVLIRDGQQLGSYRQLFGDELCDYPTALETYYANGAPSNWMENFISPYAAAHPWEDWAETWAHYLHLMDTLETAAEFGMHITSPGPIAEDGNPIARGEDPYRIDDFGELVKRWLPLCFALNSLSRSMGHPDFYPFVLSAPVIEKLAFIHRLCR